MKENSMKVRLDYVASLCEEMDKTTEEVVLNDSDWTVSSLCQWLIADGREALASSDIHLALNGRVCHADDKVSDGDKLTFFPPIIGG